MFILNIKHKTYLCDLITGLCYFIKKHFRLKRHIDRNKTSPVIVFHALDSFEMEITFLVALVILGIFTHFQASKISSADKIVWNLESTWLVASLVYWCKEVK